MTFSQIKMSGKVTDSLGTPLELANIILIDSESNTLETFAMSDNQGVYKLNLKKNNNYNLQVSYIGMATFSQTFKSGESVEAADVIDRDMHFLYSDGEMWHFMEPNSFEQFAANEAAVSNAKLWITDQDVCQITLWNNEPIVVVAPNFVELEVIETDPGVRGDTASGGVKPAKLSTGAIVRVPLFIEEGEILKIDTRSQEYVSRVK